MGLSGKLVSKTNIKSDGDVFHKLYREKPHQISDICPQKIQNCGLHEGEWGAVGSVVVWNFFLDGKNMVAKDIIEAIDEEKKSITYKMIEGDLLEQYKSLKLTVEVDTSGGEDNLVTWIIEYEKVKEEVGEPHSLMELCIHATKDVETHHLTTNPSII